VVPEAGITGKYLSKAGPALESGGRALWEGGKSLIGRLTGKEAATTGEQAAAGAVRPAGPAEQAGKAAAPDSAPAGAPHVDGPAPVVGGKPTGSGGPAAGEPEFLSGPAKNLPLEKAGPAAGDGEPLSQVRQNYNNGHAAADAIRDRFPGAEREVSFNTKDGQRRVDVLTPDGEAIESKVGRTAYTQRVRDELAKDVALLNQRNGVVHSVRWEFSHSPVTGKSGPTPRLEQALNDAHIPWGNNP
jgi:hypothetical protein